MLNILQISQLILITALEIMYCCSCLKLVEVKKLIQDFIVYQMQSLVLCPGLSGSEGFLFPLH